MSLLFDLKLIVLLIAFGNNGQISEMNMKLSDSNNGLKTIEITFIIFKINSKISASFVVHVAGIIYETGVTGAHFLWY